MHCINVKGEGDAFLAEFSPKMYNNLSLQYIRIPSINKLPLISKKGSTTKKKRENFCQTT